MSNTVPDQFKGFAVSSTETWNKPKLTSYDRKAINPTDVVIKNICCGLCGTDIHTLTGAWKALQRNDQVVGHEIIGHVIAVGDDVKSVKVGDRVGVGAASASCMNCSRCRSDNEQYCPKHVATYAAEDHFSNNYVTQGGYASHSIANEQFVFPIPDSMESAIAAPLMCAGLTVYSPLVRNLRNIEKPAVGIIGIGGLGHLALQFAKALGAEVYAFSRGSSKKDEAISFGADGYVATQEEDNWDEQLFDKFHMILNCASGVDDFTLNKYLRTLKVDGKFISVGLPPSDDTTQVHPFTFILNASSYGASLLGSKAEAIEMLELAAEKNIKPMIEEIPITEENCNKALDRCAKGDVRYRFVFTKFDEAFA